MNSSMRRRIGEEKVTPDSRLERESRSAIEGDSVRSGETGEVSWHVGKSVESLRNYEYEANHRVNHSSNEYNANGKAELRSPDGVALFFWGDFDRGRLPRI